MYIGDGEREREREYIGLDAIRIYLYLPLQILYIEYLSRFLHMGNYVTRQPGLEHSADGDWKALRRGIPEQNVTWSLDIVKLLKCCHKLLASCFGFLTGTRPKSSSRACPCNNQLGWRQRKSRFFLSFRWERAPLPISGTLAIMVPYPRDHPDLTYINV